MSRYLQSTYFINSDHPDLLALAEKLTKNTRDETEKARRLFYFVRDMIFYNPYAPFEKREDYQAHIVLERREGFCIQKAIVLAALVRACGIPARLRLADIRNHLIPPRLAEVMETDIFYFHGYDELFLRGKWIKVTPTFDSRMCERLGLIPVEFDGIHHALFNSHTRDGRLHVEYVRQRGYFHDFPFEDVLKGFHDLYGEEMMARWKEASRLNRKKYVNQEPT
jgi:transglutaminase-like putative cysteine protease